MVRKKAGYIGLAPGRTEVGDVIGVFEGGKAPLVMRPHGQQWELIGDSYIHGVMHGEAFKPSKCQAMSFI